MHVLIGLAVTTRGSAYESLVGGRNNLVALFSARILPPES